MNLQAMHIIIIYECVYDATLSHKTHTHQYIIITLHLQTT